MTIQHEITLDELHDLVVAFENKDSITLRDMAENYSSSNGFYPTYLTDETYIENQSIFSQHNSKVVTEMLLKSLEKAGYVIVKKESELGLNKVSALPYDPRLNPLHEPSDYNTRQ